MLIEEKAEGGDMLAQIAHARTRRSSTGFSRVCEAAGVALYRRNAAASSVDDCDARPPASDHDVQNLSLNVAR